MPQRYDADSLLARLNQQLPPRTTVPNPGGVLHPAFGGLGHSNDIGNVDLIRVKHEDVDVVDDLPAPWSPQQHRPSVGRSLSSFGFGDRTEEMEPLPAVYGTESERPERPTLQDRRQSSSPSVVLPSLNLHNHFGFGHEDPASDSVSPEPVIKHEIPRGESLEHESFFKVELEAVSEMVCGCGPRLAAAQHCGIAKGLVGETSRLPGICQCSDAQDDVA